jgi:hypothetical protein
MGLFPSCTTDPSDESLGYFRVSQPWEDAVRFDIEGAEETERFAEE